MAQSVRDLMHEGCECIGEDSTVHEAARKLAELDVGSMPICGQDDRLKGMITDRDIVVKVIAKDKDPRQTRVGELAQGTPVYVKADAKVDEALGLMKEHQIRRLPVIDNQRLVGILSQADVATHVKDAKTGDLVGAISEH